jgi:flagellar biosynthesis/type III secretory pathway chaperone
MIDQLTARARVRQLIALLEQERALLLSGTLSALADLGKQRDRLLVHLSNPGPATERALIDQADLIRELATRNRRLLEAALRGTEAARLRRTGSPGADTMTTYTASGQRVVMSGPAITGPHRA